MKNYNKSQLFLEQFFKNILSIEYDYNTNYPCNKSCDDDYCRCAEIDDFKITKFNFNNIKTDFVNLCKENKLIKSSFDEYGIEKLLILNGCFKIENFSKVVENGYYGEEFIGVKFNNFKQIAKEIDCLLSLNNEDSKIEFLLLKEYGNIPPLYQNLHWVEEKVSIDSIKFKEKILNDAKNDNIKAPYPLQENNKVICLQQNKFFLLIDGYHRLSLEKEKNNKQIHIIKGIKK